MADFITQFTANEVVSRENFNSRITQANTAMANIKSSIDNHVADGNNPHKTTLAQVGGSNANLLHNWYWANPISQRGAISQTADNDNIDRWFTYSVGTNAFQVATYPSYLQISCTAGWVIEAQRLERLPYGTYTLSVQLYDGAKYSATLNWQGSLITSNIVPGLILGLDLSLEHPMYFVQVAAGYTFNIVAVKLEVGKVSTLAGDALPDLQQELAKCQRYYEEIVDCVYFPNAPSFGTSIFYKVPKRIVGTVTVQSINGVNGYVSYHNGTTWVDVPVGQLLAYTTHVYIAVVDAAITNRLVGFRVYASATL